MKDWWLRLRLPAEARSYGAEILGGGVYKLGRPWWYPSGRAGGRDSTTTHVRVVSFRDYTGGTARIWSTGQGLQRKVADVEAFQRLVEKLA